MAEDMRRCFRKQISQQVLNAMMDIEKIREVLHRLQRFFKVYLRRKLPQHFMHFPENIVRNCSAQ